MPPASKREKRSPAGGGNTDRDRRKTPGYLMYSGISMV